MLDLYPYSAGWKSTDTSLAAAREIDDAAKFVRQKVLIALQGSLIGMTSREVAAATRIDIDTVKPRISELRKDGLVVDSGERRKESKLRGGNPKAVIVWRAS